MLLGGPTWVGLIFSVAGIVVVVYTGCRVGRPTAGVTPDRTLGAPDGRLLFSERTRTDYGRRSTDIDPATVAVERNQRSCQVNNCTSAEEP
jgi:hypothetical protein